MNNKKKIGIVTWWESQDNYGQQLQHWAMQHYLKKCGHAPFLIRYSLQPSPSKKKAIKRIKQFAKDCIVWLGRNTPVGKVKMVYNFCLRIVGRDTMLRKFDMFRQKELSLSKLYYSYEELCITPPKADIYLAGSDQIWNLDLPTSLWRVFFLQFGNKDIKRVSYAPSMPLENPTEEQIGLLKQYLCTFDCISTREDNSVRICRSLGFEAQKVLDPTLLLNMDAYSKISDKTTPYSDYVYIYSLNYTSIDEIPIDQIKDYIAAKNLEIVVTPSSGYVPASEMFEDVKYDYASIPRWLANIQDAKMVITSSFHGIVFAILMHKHFIYTPLIGKYASGNKRVIGLLDELQLTNMILNPNNPLAYYFEQVIDWDKVDNRLLKIRKSSFEYLNMALK